MIQGDARVSRDFRWLWSAYVVSAAGSGIGAGALPIVAVIVLHASAFQVVLLAALSAAASAIIALPFGAAIEYRRKRPVMICADLVRFSALLSVPLADVLGWLTFTQLCVVGICQTAATIAFTSASGANLKARTDSGNRMSANSRFETVNWISQAAGPPAGGGLISVAGAIATLVADGTSFLLSALAVSFMGDPEQAPPERSPQRNSRAEIVSGWHYIFARQGLRALFYNAMLFGGTVMMTSPLLAVFMMRDLSFGPFDYTLALGIPCLGGVAGSWLSPRLTARFGQRAVLLGSGILRTPWMLVLPFAATGVPGLAMIVAAETGLLLAAGVFNPSFATYRMNATDDGFMSRVAISWSVSSKFVQPVFILASGLLVEVISIRAVLLIAGVGCLASATLLPWRRESTDRDPEATAPSPSMAAIGSDAPAADAQEPGRLSRDGTGPGRAPLPPRTRTWPAAGSGTSSCPAARRSTRPPRPRSAAIHLERPQQGQPDRVGQRPHRPRVAQLAPRGRSAFRSALPGIVAARALARKISVARHIATMSLRRQRRNP
jgi:MFS family permease